MRRYIFGAGASAAEGSVVPIFSALPTVSLRKTVRARLEIVWEFLEHFTEAGQQLKLV